MFRFVDPLKERDECRAGVGSAEKPERSCTRNGIISTGSTIPLVSQPLRGSIVWMGVTLPPRNKTGTILKK